MRTVRVTAFLGISILAFTVYAVSTSSRQPAAFDFVIR